MHQECELRVGELRCAVLMESDKNAREQTEKMGQVLGTFCNNLYKDTKWDHSLLVMVA